MKLQGSIVALITPFHADGTVNFERLGEILDWHVAQGTDGILVLGTTGGIFHHEHEEDDEVCRFAIDRVAGRVPVIAGSGSNSTETQLEKSKKYARMGADALLCITPYYIKANAEGMYRHFADEADAVDVPVILYNVPGRTGCAIPEETLARLARHPNICGIKEASGDIPMRQGLPGTSPTISRCSVATTTLLCRFCPWEPAGLSRSGPILCRQPAIRWSWIIWKAGASRREKAQLK